MHSFEGGGGGGGARQEQDEQESLIGTVAPTATALNKFGKAKFLAVLTVYVTPLAMAMRNERIYYPPTFASPPPYVQPTMHPRSFSLCALVCGILYVMQRKLATHLEWKMNVFDSATQKETGLRMGYLGALVYFAGRLGSRLDAEPATFCALVACYTFAFGLLFEIVKHSNIEFTKECTSNPATLLLSGFTTALVAGLVVNHFSNIQALEWHNEAQDHFLIGKFLPTSVCLLFLVVGFHASLTLAPGDSEAHFHHWYTGFFGANFCVFDSQVSKISQAMLLGIYLHGAALFGVEQCFYAAEKEVS